MKTIFRSIIAMMVAFVAVSASAQRVVNGIDTHNYQVCGEYLVKNSLDTIRNVSNLNKDGMSGVVKRSVYLKGNEMIVFKDTIWELKRIEQVSDTTKLKKMQEVSEEALTAEKLSEGNPRDYYFGHSKELEAYVRSQGLNYPEAGKIPVQVSDKYGWSVKLHAGYGFAKGANGMVGGVGLGYGREYWDASISAEIGRSKYSDNAIKAGESYITGRVEGALAFRPFRLDINDVNRVSILAGGGLEYGETNSKAYTSESGEVSYLSSKGGIPYWLVGVKYERRIFGTGNSLWLSLQYIDNHAVIQNNSNQRLGTILLKVGVDLGVFRNKVSLKN